MRIRSGWNSEYARKKYDVELGEEDIPRLLLSARLPIEAASLLTANEVHNLLYWSAELLARQTLGAFDPTQKEHLEKEVAGLRASLRDLLLGVRERGRALGLEESTAGADPGWPPQ